VKPDVLLLGKPLGGGLPLSALLVNADLFHALGLAKHGSTLGGSPMACRLGLEFLDVVEDEKLLDLVTDTGAYLGQKLRDLAVSSDIGVEARGIGLIQGLEMTIPGRPMAEEALEQGLMLNFVQGNVMRFLPAFVLERSHVDAAMEIIEPLMAKATEAATLETLVTR
jgi:acetylornithine/succinyldiaminopimelate/putrescine aminotransferase